MSRVYGKAVYNIEVVNPRHIEHGVKETYLDDRKLKSNIIPDLSDGKSHRVRVVMG